MQLAMIGLGKMGGNMTERLMRDGHQLVAFDRDPAVVGKYQSLGVRLVGVDYLSVEQFHSPHHRTHRTLLENGVVIVEGMVLSEPPAGDYELYCLPMLLAGLDGAPARAVLIG